jgi:putative ABC transport system permease protein
MKYLFKDQFKKISKNILNLVSLSLLLILIIATFVTIKSSTSRLIEDYDSYLESQTVEDFQFHIKSIDVELIGGTATWNLCQELDMEFECAYYISLGTEEAYTLLNHSINQEMEQYPELVEAFVDSYLSDFEEEYDILTEKRLQSDLVDGSLSYRFLSVTESINQAYILEGRLPQDKTEIALLPEYAQYHNYQLDDTISIAGKDYTITGLIYFPDYIFPIYYMNALDIETETLAMITKEAFEDLESNIETYYVAKGDLSSILDVTTFKELNEIDPSTLGNATDFLSQIRPASTNYKITMLLIETDNASIFMNAFLSIFIVFIGLLLSIFIKKYMDQNKQDISIYQSLGYTNTEIKLSLMVFPILLSFMILFAYLLGTLLSYLTFEMYAVRYLYPKAPFHLQWDIFLYGAILPIFLILSISYIFISKNIQKKSKTKRWNHKIFSYTPLKTSIQSFLLFLSVSTLLLFGINANTMFPDFVSYTKQGNDYVEAIRLDYFSNQELDPSYETFTRLQAINQTLNNQDYSFSFNIYGINPNNDLYAIIDDDYSQNQLLNDGIIISEYIHYNQGIEIGDSLSFLVENTLFTYEVVGISNELIENAAYMLQEPLNQSYLLDGTYYNGIFTTDTLYDSNQITTRIHYQNALNDIFTTLRTSGFIINSVVVLSVVISIFMLSYILYNYLEDNKVNIAILKAMGYSTIEINKKYLSSLLIVFVFAFIASIPLVNLTFDLLLKNIIDSVGYVLIVDLTFSNIVIAFLLLVFIMVITLLQTQKHFSSLQVSKILKENIK